MSFSGEEKADVIKNRENVLKDFNVDISNTVFCQQVHGDNIHVVTMNDVGRGSKDMESGIPNTDALITNLPNIFLSLLVADCVPIILYDPIRKVVGVVHAGWRGTMINIAGKTIQKMINEFETNPKDVLVGIGPSIGPDCFRVGEEVVIASKENNLEKFLARKNNEIYFDLWQANRDQLLVIGVSSENIEISAICTHCSEDYFSFRRDNDAQRFMVGVMMRG